MDEPVPLRLASDFRDFYDHRFAGSWRTETPVWHRMARASRPRAEDFGLLEWAGFICPAPRGRLDSFAEDALVVAYIDPFAHRGEGKVRGRADVLLRMGVAQATYAAPLLVGNLGTSLRLLVVGRSFFWLTYRTRDSSEWRSNVGDVEITWAEPSVEFQILAYRAIEKLARKLGEPLLAVDFVDGGGDMPVAVDLNTAPGIAGTPVERVCDAETAARFAQGIADRWREVARG